MAKKKTAAKTAESNIKRVYVLADGTTYDILSETGKYYICAYGTQFRKSANRGKVESVEIESAESEEA